VCKIYDSENWNKVVSEGQDHYHLNHCHCPCLMVLCPTCNSSLLSIPLSLSLIFSILDTGCRWWESCKSVSCFVSDSDDEVEERCSVVDSDIESEHVGGDKPSRGETLSSCDSWNYVINLALNFQ
jgi:hypothetical protein